MQYITTRSKRNILRHLIYSLATSDDVRVYIGAFLVGIIFGIAMLAKV